MGDVVKFGRVPFKIKESSVEKGRIKREESIQNDNENLKSLEKNITDIESLDGENDLNIVLKEMISASKKAQIES